MKAHLFFGVFVYIMHMRTYKFGPAISEAIVWYEVLVLKFNWPSHRRTRMQLFSMKKFTYDPWNGTTDEWYMME